ncbi:MAG TPA: hypothetical protein VFZ01_18290, partial [Geminicoccaceae bacterium]
GNAALCAAITARPGGASVLVLEGAPRFYRGGNARHTRNMRVGHDAPSEVLTGPYPEEESFDDLIRVTGGETDEELARFGRTRSGTTVSWWDHPVVLGPLGGIGLVVGPVRLLRARRKRAPARRAPAQQGMDVALIWMPLLTGLTGLLLLVLRATPAIGLLLALHLNFVFALFFTMPYGKSCTASTGSRRWSATRASARGW